MDNILFALSSVFTLQVLIAMFAGVAIGIIIGALPGLSSIMGIALILPMTFGMEPATGMLLLIGVYCGGVYGGSITAILLRAPGTAASAATVADGFSLAQQGRASYALNLSIYASVAGGLFSGVVLLFAAPQVARFALGFGPPEYFMLAMFGLAVISSVSGKFLSKGLLMAAAGLLVTTIGLDPISGEGRFLFNSHYLLSGIDLVPALVGLFAVSEVFNQIEKGATKIAKTISYGEEKFSVRMMKPFSKLTLKSSLIGTIIGIIPGTGSPIASFIAYTDAKRSSKDPDSFGKGNAEGIVSSEAANNGTTGATLIPMMTLGIPGDTATAVLMGGLLIHGLNPGPQLFTDYGGIVYTIMIGFIIINIIMFFQAKFAIRFFAKVSTIPTTILIPLVMVFCLVGSYAVSNSMYSVIIAIVFGIIGYIAQKFDYPVAPMLIAIVLGPIAETALRQSLIISKGSFFIFFERPIALLFFVLCIFAFSIPFIQNRVIKKKGLLKHGL